MAEPVQIPSVGLRAALRRSFSGLMPAPEPLLFPLQLQAKTMHVGRDHRERHRATKPLLTASLQL